MKLARTWVAAVVLLTAMPVHAQETTQTKSGRRRPVPQVRTIVTGYSGIFGRFIFGRPGIGLPVVRPRLAWVVDEFIEEGRPLGFSPGAFGYSSFAKPQPAWNGWPYYSAGRDEAPKNPPPPKVESETAVLEGRAQWKAGRMAEALADFKRAVAADLANGTARLHMALGLFATGDLKNADKALVSALESVGVEDVAAIRLNELFRNPRERLRFEERLIPARDGNGTLSVALALHLLGLKDRAATLLKSSQDPAARKLSDVLPD